MRAKVGLSVFAASSVVVASLMSLGQVRADDQATDPKTTADPASDITDVYAFMKPTADAGASDSVVLVMNVSAHTGQSARFSDKVEYSFLVRRVTSLSPIELESTDFRVNCVFVDTAVQFMTCDLPGIGKKAISVGDLGADSAAAGYRLFAGERSDPAFIDRNAVATTTSSGALKFSSPGTNANQGQNVLSIVVEVPVTVFRTGDAGTATPILSVSAHTTRT